MDLQSLSVPELRNHQVAIAKQIELKKKQSVKDALNAANEAVKQHGFESVHEVINGATVKEAKERKAIEPKYRNSHGLTWTGRGKKPLWVIAGLEAGYSLESFLIA